MGQQLASQLCGLGLQILADRMEAPDCNDDPDGPPQYSGCQVYMVCIALDYPGTGNELTCTKDGDNMRALWQACGLPASNLTVFYNNDGHKGNVLGAIEGMGQQCQPGDYFIFYYSGHGSSVPDKDGDEADGKDEALCLVTPEGKIDWNAFLTDDELAEAMTSNIEEGVKVIIMSDCCHSGTISDFRTADWGGLHACSLSGCADNQTSGDTGKGGIFTHSLLMAIADSGDGSYSIGQLYNKTLEFDETVFASEQDIKCACSSASGSPSNMAWPLVPKNGYSAPWGC